MSKSIGNVIDPKDILKTFGAEPFRLWTAIEGNLDRTDFRCSFDRIAGAKKTLTKLWNVARFISMFQSSGNDIKLTESDKWILSEVNELISYTEKHYKKYDFHNPNLKIKNFVWETFASHYIEIVKNRAYNKDGRFSKEEQNGAIYALNKSLEVVLKLLAPIIPFLTYKIYMELKGDDIHFTNFPKVEKDYKSEIKTKEISELNSNIWKFKKEADLSLKSPIEKIILPKMFKLIEKDLIEMHGIRNIAYGEELKIVLRK
jgi:valyl-tRNA synthetase